MSEKVTLGTVYTPTGDEDGDNSPLGGRDEPETEPRLGTEGRIEGFANLDDALDLDQVIARFRANTNAGIAASTQREYITIFKKLLRRSGLLDEDDKLIGAQTKRVFSGQQGRRLILAFVGSVGQKSWNYHTAGLKKIWADGLDVAWPLHPRDLNRAEVYEPRAAPLMKSVLTVANAIETVRDPWLKLMLLFFWQYGFRPSHLVNFKWRNIERDPDGEPYAVFALEAGFKRRSPIRAVLFPDVKKALLEWEKVSPNTSPDVAVFCWKDLYGQLDGSRPTYAEQLRDHLYAFEKSRELQKLQPNAARHFVTTTTLKAGLSEIATNYLMGHKVTQDRSHRRDYRYEEVEVCLEEQKQVFPNGPLGWISGVKIETTGLPKDIVNLVASFWSGQTGMTAMEFANQLDKLQRLDKVKQLQKVEVPKIGL